MLFVGKVETALDEAGFRRIPLEPSARVQAEANE
jgi:hypothetical protein